MYTNGFTGQKFLSILGFKDAAGNTYAFLEREFADQSEHVTLAQFMDTDAVMNDSNGSYGRCFGWEGAQS